MKTILVATDFSPEANNAAIYASNFAADTGAKILSKGTDGRHNDDTDTNVAWFLHFYRMILKSDFIHQQLLLQ